MILYALRHKTSGELMPLTRKNKGYSHWNPSNTTHKMVARIVGVPRLFSSMSNAKRCISSWVTFANSSYRGYTNSHGEDDYDVCENPDGRTKDDLEIVKVEVRLK